MFGMKQRDYDLLANADLDKLADNLSEQMVRRDNFFHNCWMLMKKESPHLAEEMQKVELIISGYDPDAKEVEKEKDDVPEPVVL